MRLEMRLALWALASAFLFLSIDWATSIRIFPVPHEQYEGDCPEHNETKQCTSLRSTVFEGAQPMVYRIGCWLDAHNGAITGVATGLLAIITAWLVFVAREQSRTTRAQLRAYVFPKKIGVNLYIGQVPKYCVLIRNTGQTPAYKLHCIDRFASVSFPLLGATS